MIVQVVIIVVFLLNSVLRRFNKEGIVHRTFKIERIFFFSDAVVGGDRAFSEADIINAVG